MTVVQQGKRPDGPQAPRAQSTKELLRIEEITADAGTQVRAAIDEAVVAESKAEQHASLLDPRRVLRRPGG